MAIDISDIMRQHAGVTMRVCRQENIMSEPTKKPAKPSVGQTQQIEPPADDERPRPTRPPTVADFIIDLDETDPLRRFRF
jgi:hypothetical protein